MMGSMGLSLVAAFDDLCRHGSVLNEDTESKFLEFVNTTEAFRQRWTSSESECQRLHAQLVQANTEITRLENNVKQAKNLLDNEKKRRFLVEQDRDALERQLNSIRELIFSEPQAVNNETREKMLRLSQSVAQARPRERRSSQRLGTICESMGSLLSADDVSLDFTEEDLDVSHLRSGRVIQRGRGQKRVSDADTEEDELGATRARRRTRKAKRRNRQSSPVAAQAPQHTSSEQAAVVSGDALVATTTVTVPASGPVTATSQLRARSPSPQQRRRSSRGAAKKSMERSFSEPPPLQRTPAAPPLTRTPSTVIPWWRSAIRPYRLADGDTSPPTSLASTVDGLGGSAWDMGRTPLGGLQATPYRTPETPFSPGLRHFNSATKGLGGPQHTFFEKTVIKPENCQPCGKRVRFGKTALRCRECRAVCHPQCREQVPVPCVPSALTPTSRGHQAGRLADYTPLRGLMVPGLVQHCVNELEARGLNEVGIYRIPGSEREVKELKARFLRGKGIPRLDQTDLHVICGCVKDFLRALQEPVVTHTLWHDFVRAASADDTPALYQAISELPQPNRDTLAFMLLHLQRVSDVPDNKMTTSSLSKVFGPTLVGYSSTDLEPSALLMETRQQQMVMERLMALSSDYWSKFLEAAAQEAMLYDPQSTPLRSGAGPQTRAGSRHGSYR